MPEHPDPRLVVERAALPAYAPADMRPDQRFPVTSRGCLGLLGGLRPPPRGGVVQAEGERVTVQLPPPPGVYGFATFFRHDPQVIEYSRRALDEYRSQYEEPDGFPYPLRIREARHTGLPAQLNGFLDEHESLDTPDAADGVASGWLFQDLRSKALFGIDTAEAQQRLRYTGAIQVHEEQYKREVEQPLEADVSNRTMVHARYQQWHQEWPVFGGGVVVHLAAGDRRVSVSSSYFPVPADTTLAPRIDEVRAIELAQQALAGYHDGPEAVGLSWPVLHPWLAGPEADDPPAEAWQPFHTRVAEKLVQALAAFSATHDHVFTEMEALAESDLPGSRHDLLARLRPAWESRDELNLVEWYADVAPYAGSELFIFPFAGRYHLAYQVELISPTGDQAWRVFVDAETGEVLGQPESLVAHAHYYRTAADVLAADVPNGNHLTDLSESELGQLATDIAEFTWLKYHSDSGSTGDVNLASVDTTDDATPDVRLEAVNVAAHARDIYRHLAGILGPGANVLRSYTEGGETHQPGLEIFVGKGGQHLAMGFNQASLLHPKPITFQTDSGAGLETGETETGETRKVRKPSLDPEVIHHEIAHGLMWLLNRSPFDQQIASVPFGRALVEGYANYFARSLSARQDLASDLNLWARAAYRQAVWGDDWSLSRDKRETGADLLPAPNLYPHRETVGFPVYDVGMVWARALWDIRGLLAGTHGALGPDLADQLALDAFSYVHGWVANFEMAAEGLIDSARRNAEVTEDQVAAIITLFAQRGILAERGVQTLALAEDSQGEEVLLVGTDAGLKRSTDGGHTWHNWGNLSGDGVLQGVVALAAEDTTVYAAAEDGVYKRGTADAAWSPVGEWPAEHRPFCIVVADGKVYVGTGRGVLFHDSTTTQDWPRWELSQSPFEDLVLDVAMGVSGLQTHLYVANMRAPRRRSLLLTVLFDWSSTGELKEEDEVTPSTDDAGEEEVGLSTAIAVDNDRAYAGTLAHGIWEQLLQPDATTWSQIATKENLANGAVLALRSHQGHLFAATTSGLFEGTRVNGDWTWQQVQIENASVDIVTDVLPTDGRLLVGTASQGLWVRDGTQWIQHSDIGT